LKGVPSPCVQRNQTAVNIFFSFQAEKKGSRILFFSMKRNRTVALVGKVLSLSHQANKRINAELRWWRKKTVRGDKRKQHIFRKKLVPTKRNEGGGEKKACKRRSSEWKKYVFVQLLVDNSSESSPLVSISFSALCYIPS
jgi:hypothetical protein